MTFIKTSSLVKLIILLGVFILFLSGSIDLVKFSLTELPFFEINSRMLNEAGYLQRVFEQLVLSTEFLLMLAAGTIVCCIVPFLPPLKGFVLSLAATLITLLLSRFSYQDTILPIEFVILTLVILYILNVLISYIFEIKARQKLIATFGHYIPPHLVKELSTDPDKLSLDGEWKVMTVFFCDLQDFTGVSEQLNPKQLNMLLNEYFTVMTEIIFRHEGTIDKYIGDAIMAFWNAPLSQPQHAQRAVESALEMDKAIQDLAKTFVARGWPGPSMGIGINTGRAHVGNLGSEYRVNYTAIGDAVNLASRLETLTRTYRVPIIISEDSMRELTGITCREIDLVQVKGRKHQTRIYQPLCHDAELTGTLKEKLILHEQALELYYAGKLENAGRLFKELYQQDRNDKYYKVMVKRIIEMNSK